MKPFPQQPAILPTQQLDPMVLIDGQTHGDGQLAVRWRKGQVLRVDGRGRMEPDGQFRLDQTIARGDGSLDHRTWSEFCRSRRAWRSVGEADGDHDPHSATGLNAASSAPDPTSRSERIFAQYVLRLATHETQ